MSQLFGKATPPMPAIPPAPAPPPAAQSPTGPRPQKATQVPSLLGLAAAGQQAGAMGGTGQSRGGKSLVGQ